LTKSNKNLEDCYWGIY